MSYLLKIISAVAFIFITSSVGFCSLDESVSEVSKITGVKAGRVAKIAQLSYTLEEALKLALSGKTDEALLKASEISINTGFKADDVKQAKSTKFQILKRAYRYNDALAIGKELSDYHPNFRIREEEARALAGYQSKREKQVIYNFLDLFLKKNEKLLPPRVHNLNTLAIIIRMYETMGDIDEALVWVEKYRSYYFPKKEKKKPSGVSQKKREGLNLLKEALLRDKAEGKNTYAQELINTTDYFGFV